MVRTEYIKPSLPELPEEPVYYRVIWHKVGQDYCVDEKNAKNLLKNIELMRSYQNDLKTILESLKEVQR